MNTAINTQIVYVTPEIATELLKMNIGNRLIRPGHVDFWAGIITRGEWATTHQGIAISSLHLGI